MRMGNEYAVERTMGRTESGKCQSKTHKTCRDTLTLWIVEKLAEICGGSYYVSFTSIHDVRIHPVSTVQPRRVLRSLKDVNKMFNQASDVLSRQIFVYDNEKKELKPMEM